MKTVVHQCKNSGMVKLTKVIEMSVVRGCKQGEIENGNIKTGFDRQGESQQDNWLTSGIDFGVCGIDSGLCRIVQPCNAWRFGRLPVEYRDR